MTRETQRTILKAVFEGKIGPKTADELLAMPDKDWNYLRQRITDERTNEKGLRAHCFECGCPVYIKVDRNGLPLFSHYADSDPTCPWYTGKPLSPDQIKAKQYKGQQESPAHRLMCKMLSDLVQLDKRYLSHKVEKYLPPTENNYGRFPDVYVEWEECGPFVIEFQMSNTFQIEISNRCIHYEREKIPLLWILSDLDFNKRPAQCFKDIMQRHRGNAFVMDSKAFNESQRLKTLILSCYLNEEAEISGPHLVRFDELKKDSNFLFYYKDCIVSPIIAEAKDNRKKWYKALENMKSLSTTDTAIEEAINKTPCEISYERLRLIAATFSIALAANNKWKNYLDRQPTISAMINTFLNKRATAKYAIVISNILNNTKAGELVNPSVWSHINRELSNTEQIRAGAPEYKIMKFLLPELFDPLVQEKLEYYEEFPEWINSRNQMN